MCCKNNPNISSNKQAWHIFTIHSSLCIKKPQTTQTETLQIQTVHHRNGSHQETDENKSKS